jgi:hypothetical protein
VRLEHLRRDAAILADQAEQEVLGPDVLVPELQCLAQRELERLLGSRRERYVPGCRPRPAPDDRIHRRPDIVRADAERGNRLRRETIVFRQEAEQDVLGPDVIVVARPGLVLRVHDNPPRTVGKPLKHQCRRA